ncbi:ABC transporter ATP-binding protein [Williamsia sterculiae]|uniref:ABC-2 type transport system ATP-binding protein n=1 Tax=Williamsia sterculiae TaxID=1344003 RepID=A0A1N7H974_9NOCA|nr:ABC transporter ATP-binding protein [Williamsia sterculiae]SIS21250.1 ABC-2 type transport system ATP-binding protein [Williamsia sterculiae]
MIEVEHLSKRYGDHLVVDDLTFTVEPGTVTGFLGPNGAGKSTTMRMIAGLDAPTAGRVLVNGRPYPQSSRPMAEMGMLLDAKGIHPGRSARNHLLALAQTNAIPSSRVDEVLAMVGLTDVARGRVGGFSLGMGQRLGVATALLGNPQVVVLDEPVNGLDPEGVLWIRNLLTTLAREGRTVFISSHLMSEMALTATRLVVIGQGKLLADTTVDDFVADATGGWVTVGTPDADELAVLLRGPAVEVRRDGPEQLRVTGLTARQIGTAAWEAHMPVHELAAHQPSLEEAFMQMTRESVEYHAADPASTSTTSTTPETVGAAS